jgi:hypothetical protein
LNTSAVAGVLSGTSTPAFIGASPTESELFNTYWKIASKVSIEIPAGGSHKHHSYYDLSAILTTTRYNSSALLGGVTRNIMIVARGVPMLDSTLGTVLSMAPELLVQHSISYHAMQIPYSDKSSSYSTTRAVVGGDTWKAPQASGTPASGSGNTFGQEF